jgi:hypothetical protein
MTEHNRFDRLSADEARRALYIDFEGEGRRGGLQVPPILLGVYRNGETPTVDLLDPAFASLEGRVASLHEAVLHLVMRAEKRKRRIVSWSIHELEVVQTLGTEDPGLVRRFEAWFANGKLVAQRWRWHCHDGDKPSSGRLADYFKLLPYPVPVDAVGGNVGDTIRSVRGSIEGGRDLTPGQRERWRRLIEHNRQDCIGLRELCIRAAREIEEADGRRRGASRPRA